MPPCVQVRVRQAEWESPQDRTEVVVHEPAHHRQHKHQEDDRVPPLGVEDNAPLLFGGLAAEPRHERREAPGHDDEAGGEAAAHEASPGLVPGRVLLSQQHCGRDCHAIDPGKPRRVPAVQAPQHGGGGVQRVPEHGDLVAELHGVPEGRVEEDAADANNHDQHGHERVLRACAVAGQKDGRQHDEGRVGGRVDRLRHPVDQLVVRLTPVELRVRLAPPAAGPPMPEVVRDAEEVAGGREYHEDCHH
mmetsp:Transcript_103000/g.291178  ORF Transcript_103000/g.291178 Transcript_103000/m.291178 type:complete len:247 (-) Transcript_103000:8-748(-)